MRVTYQMVKGMTVEQLALTVSEAIAEGWICQGSPAWHERGLCWVQAMVRGPQPQNGDVRLREQKRR